MNVIGGAIAKVSWSMVLTGYWILVKPGGGEATTNLHYWTYGLVGSDYSKPIESFRNRLDVF